MPDQFPNTIGTGTDIACQDHSHTPTDIKVTASIIHTGVIPDHITDITNEALQDTISPALIAIAVTHHTGDHLHIEVYQPIPEITAGPDHAHHINQVRTPHLNPHPVPTEQQQKPQDKKQRRVMIDNPESDYYSSDDTSSDSEDDLN